MFNSRYNIVDKGFYSHAQSSGCMIIKQYIIVEENSKRFLLLRFWNASALVINSMELVIEQIGVNKQVIDTSVVQVEGIQVQPGGTYTTVNGIVISEKCVDFNVFIRYVKSGDYEYYERGGKTVPKYNSQPKAKKRSKEYGRTVISKRNLFSSKLSAGVAVLLILAFFIIGICFSV